MQGYQLTFFTQQDRHHGSQTLAEWLLQEARRMGIGGATMIAASEGFGRDRRLHAARFFELGEQPVELTMAVSGEEAAKLFARLAEEDVRIFYVKVPIEYGTTGKA